jgi:16S rRNA A1518/A1519 N6-dimethyltransferase RsmA/KsgA/DIM1 with predicted DNA glycosylase/AP lyase activity
MLLRLVYNINKHLKQVNKEDLIPKQNVTSTVVTIKKYRNFNRSHHRKILTGLPFI